jgi:hypothetical protein
MEANLLEAKFAQLNPARRTMNRKGATALEAKKTSPVTTLHAVMIDKRSSFSLVDRRWHKFAIGRVSAVYRMRSCSHEEMVL